MTNISKYQEKHYFKTNYAKDYAGSISIHDQNMLINLHSHKKSYMLIYNTTYNWLCGYILQTNLWQQILLTISVA